MRITEAMGWIPYGSRSNAGFDIDFQSLKIIRCGSYLESSIGGRHQCSRIQTVTASTTMAGTPTKITY